MVKRKLTWLFWKPNKREGEALYTYKGGNLSWVWFLYKGSLGKPFHYVIQCSSSEYYARSEKHTPWDIRPTSCRQKWQTSHECNSKSCCLDNPNKSPNIEVNLPSPALIRPSHGDLMRSLPCRHGERHTSHGILAHNLVWCDSHSALANTIGEGWDSAPHRPFSIESWEERGGEDERKGKRRNVKTGERDEKGRFVRRERERLWLKLNTPCRARDSRILNVYGIRNERWILRRKEGG